MLFLGLSDGQLQSIASVIRPRTFRRNEAVVHRGQVDDTLYVIERGSVELRELLCKQARAAPVAGERAQHALFKAHEAVCLHFHALDLENYNPNLH